MSCYIKASVWNLFTEKYFFPFPKIRIIFREGGPRSDRGSDIFHSEFRERRRSNDRGCYGSQISPALAKASKPSLFVYPDTILRISYLRVLRRRRYVNLFDPQLPREIHSGCDNYSGIHTRRRTIIWFILKPFTKLSHHFFNIPLPVLNNTFSSFSLSFCVVAFCGNYTCAGGPRGSIDPTKANLGCPSPSGCTDQFCSCVYQQTLSIFGVDVNSSSSYVSENQVGSELRYPDGNVVATLSLNQTSFRFELPYSARQAPFQQLRSI